MVLGGAAGAPAGVPSAPGAPGAPGAPAGAASGADLRGSTRRRLEQRRKLRERTYNYGDKATT